MLPNPAQRPFGDERPEAAASHYEHLEIGFNYRLSYVLAGIGRGQFRVFDDRACIAALVRGVHERAVAESPVSV